MNRSLKLSLLLALALGSSQAAALELGQIHIRSALGQPLLAEIPVTLANPTEGQNLSAQLASNVVFERANISNRPTMPLLFTVVGNGNHRLIRITSSVPVNDPYLDLLIEVGSTAGHSTHEYTILLDPPGSVAQAPVTRSSTSGSGRVHQTTTDNGAETSRRAAASASAKPAAPASAPAQARTEQHSVVTSDGKYGPVERGQSLSGIARLTTPPGVDVNQMMLALKQANPDAFYRDNINALKTGAVLRVPSAHDAQAMAVAEAVAQVRQQNGDWRNGTTHAPVAVADAGTRSATSSPTANAGNEDRLALVPAQNGGTGGKGKAAHQDQQRSQEELTSLQQQSAELKSRVKDLEDINSKDQRLLSLKDSQIAELQNKLAEARKAAGLPPQAAAPATPPAPVAAPTPAPAPAPAPAVAATTHPAAPAASKPAVAAVPTPPPAAASAAKPAAAASAHAAAVPVASKPEAAPVQAKPAPVHATPRPAAPAASEAPWYMQPWAWIAAAGAVVVLLLLALLRGRRKSAGSTQNGSRQGGPSLADRFSDDVLPPHAGSDADQDELLDQLAEHPDNVGLHLELVSLYYSRRDVDHFEAAAEAMQAHISDPEQEEWQEVLHMGRDLAPEHPLFATSRPMSPTPPPFRAAAPADEHDALHPFDLDRYAAEEPPAAPRSISGEHRYDFNLTHREDFTGPPARPEPPAPVEEPASRWRFDEPAEEPAHAAAHPAEPATHEHYSDDPSDTKLDLARAYMDMGDPDGARAMLEEVLQEGSQMQRDMARRLLDELR